MGVQSIDETVAELRARWPGAVVAARRDGPLYTLFDVALGDYGRTRLTVWHYVDGPECDVYWACGAWHRDESAEATEQQSATAAVEAGLRGLAANARARAEAMAERVGKLLAQPERGGR